MLRHKKLDSDLNFGGIGLPADNNDIDIFEENNRSKSCNAFKVNENEQVCY